MAQLKDLLVTGPVYFNGQVYFNKIPTYQGKPLALNKTITVTAGSGLKIPDNATQSFDLSSDAGCIITLAHGETKPTNLYDLVNTGNTRRYINAISFDAFGHVTSIDFNTENVIQTTVGNPTQGNSRAEEFVTSISQNANGVITATTQKVQLAGANQAGLIQGGNIAKIAAGVIEEITEATKVSNPLNITVGSNSAIAYDGSGVKNISITAASLGLSAAMQFLGVTTSDVITNTAASPIKISDEDITPTNGNVVIYNKQEFVWDGSKWIELGDEGSYALKTIKIDAGACLTGGGTLGQDITIAVGEIDKTHLAANSVDTTQLCASAVTTSIINNGAVTADKLGASAVTSTKINNGAVTADKLDASAVTTNKIANLAVTNAKIANATIEGTKIKSNAINFTHLGAGLASDKGNRAVQTLVIPAAQGELHSEKYTITSGEIKKATLQYDTSLKAIKFVFA